MVDVADGSWQWYSRFENSESARRYRRDGRLVISATGRSRGHGRVLCLGGKNWPHINDYPGGGLGRTLPGAWPANLGNARSEERRVGKESRCGVGREHW